MVADKISFKWQAVSASVIGAAHERVGFPNQDAVRLFAELGNEPPLILAVSDGHGGAKYFRSEVGARLAVDSAIELGREYLSSSDGTNSLSMYKRTAEEWLPKGIVRRWRDKVTEHWESDVPSAELIETLERERGPAARRTAETDSMLAYGATLLMVLITEFFILYLQLGDGDILMVSDGGSVNRPLPKDEKLFANETTSLCGNEAWQEFRVVFQPITAAPPALILVSTDGYANSFRDEEAFSQIGPDLLTMLRTDGVEEIQASLPKWLSEASSSGSGDDITLGIICRLDTLTMGDLSGSKIDNLDVDESKGGGPASLVATDSDAEHNSNESEGWHEGRS